MHSLNELKYQVRNATGSELRMLRDCTRTYDHVVPCLLFLCSKYLVNTQGTWYDVLCSSHASFTLHIIHRWFWLFQRISKPPPVCSTRSTFFVRPHGLETQAGHVRVVTYDLFVSTLLVNHTPRSSPSTSSVVPKYWNTTPGLP
jgi:hypothetical protein